MMDRIVARVEQDSGWRQITDASRPEPEGSASDAIATASRQIAHTIKASAIVAFTDTGITALRVARERPDCPILGLTPRPETARRLAVVWGVHAVIAKEVDSFTEATDEAREEARTESMAQPGDKIVVTAGVPFRQSGGTNMVHVAKV
jgi:pyruvate kinase